MNILMSLMQLDIGGAETHVAELSKELKRRGHKVIITSKGGVYVDELEKAGIKHYTLPLHSKKPGDVMKAFSEFKRIIKEEEIDVVHSHARISSFILGKLQKKMKFPYVTTAHGVFSTKYGLKYITDWGSKTLAVSEDIKKYLIDNYKISEEDITLTVNGIDTEKFSAKTDKTEIQKELGIESGDNTVVHVCRMDKSASIVAHQLIEAISRLDNIVENLKCIIVGDGDDFEEIKKEAKNVNESLGREAIILTGARTDVNKIVSLAKLFVGVSRAALEAMASEKPSVIAGAQGYIGLFREDKLEASLATNFCCRGCEESQVDTLTQEIGAFFGLWDDEQKEIGEFSRKTVLENYSITRMADDAEKVYREVLGASV